MNNKNLISKIISGNASSSEIKKFQAWLSENEANNIEYQQQLNIWQLSSDSSINDENDCNLELAWNSFLEKKDQSFDNPSRILYKIAAVMIVVLTVGSLASYFFFRNSREDSIMFAKNLSKNLDKDVLIQNIVKNNNDKEDDNTHSIYLKRKTKRKTNNNNYSEYVLIDSSNIKLTDNSALKFLEQDKQNSRIASLMGAGIFDIKPSNQMFILETEHVIIHVEGTKFRVNEPTEKNEFVELYVIEGNMEVFEKTNISNSITLTSGEKYIFDINKKQFIQMKDNTKKPNKWKLFWKNDNNN